MSFEISLNVEAAVVLLRCLAYGQSAVSRNEQQSGVGEKINSNCEMLRKAICNELTRELLE